jgi:hypothetical protein
MEFSEFLFHDLSSCHITIYKHYGIRRSADKSLAFPIFLFAAQTKEIFFDELKKLEQRSHKCAELKGNM